MRRFITVTAIFLSLLVVAGGASAQGTLRIGMTASDVPYTGGQTDNGFEGFRFVGYQVYEPLIAWDLTRGDRLPPLVPASPSRGRCGRISPRSGCSSSGAT
jgi:peptide/nickel transport system substrate-binding protein